MDVSVGPHDIQVEIAGLHCRLGTTAALSGVSLQIPAQSVCGVVGPNGAGKTTLLRALAGTVGASAGAVLVGGRDPHATPPAELARVMAVLPQHPVAPIGITVREAVAWGRDPHLRRLGRPGPDDLRAVDEALRHTGMLALADRPVDQLSGGERHRALIARALAQTPRILLLDEPTVHLDITHQVEIMQLLRRLAAGGLTIVAALHDLNLASAYCDVMALLASGRLLDVGPPAQVVRADLIRQAYGSAATVRVNPGTGRPYLVVTGPAAAHRAEPARRVHVVGGGGTGAEVMTRCVEAGYGVSTGVVHVMDSDDEVARDLHAEVVQEAPFSPISPETARAAADLARSADAVVVAAVPIGPGNMRNLEVAAAALTAGVPVIILDGVAGRDYTGGAATAQVAAMTAQGAWLVPDVSGALDLLRRTVPV